MNPNPLRNDEDGSRFPDRRRTPLRFYYSEFGIGMNKDNQWPRIGCGILFLVIGVWVLLWAFDIIELSPRYIWIPFAVVLVALGLRLLFVKRR